MYKNQAKLPKHEHTVYSLCLPRRMASILGMLAIMGFTQAALAIPPTYSIIAPNEFALPVVKPGAGVTFFIQDLTYTDDGNVYDSNGSTTSNTTDASPKGKSLLSVTRIGRLFSLESLPNVGFYWEYLQPSAYVQAGNNTVTGLVDPLVGGAAYITPAKGLTIGTEQFLQVPIGSNELSNDYFVYYPQLFADYLHSSGFGIDVLIGAALKTDQHSNGNRVDVGNDYYADLRLRYEATHYLTPFVAYDFTTTESGQFRSVSPSNTVNVIGDSVPKSTQHNVGGGLQVFLRKDHLSSLSVMYAYGIAGENAVQTNGVEAEFLYLFP